MPLLINIAMFCMLSFWGGLVVMSPMAFAAENFGKEASSIYSFAGMLFIPVPFLMLMAYFNYTFLSMNGNKVAIFVSVAALFILVVSGSVTKLMNIQKGINNAGYTITDTQIYYDAKVITIAEAASFSLLTADDLADKISPRELNGYATDNNHVYHRGEVIKNLVPKDAKLISMEGKVFLINESQVALDEHLLVDAKPEGFSVHKRYNHWSFSAGSADLSEHYHVYFGSKKLPQVDKESFTVLSDYYAKDAKHIFRNNHEVLKEADAASFQFVEQDPRFAFDKNHVFFINTLNEHIIDGIDHSTLTPLLRNSYVKDKKYIYYIEQYETVHKLDVDYDSFITHNYEKTGADAHDKHHYFYNGTVVGDVIKMASDKNI